uniref:Saposin B-type domain-containing protein n=1 Tax=Heterorhabditis bacteriophora TaxID=37862 RepID=A0A1I7X0V3_HETBA
MDIGGEVGQRVDRELKNRERVWRTRINCMEASTKNFSSILELLKSLKTREEADARQALGMGAPSNQAKPNPAGQRNRQQPGYSRYDQEIFNKEMNTDFQIDGEMSFVGSNFAINRGGSLNKKPLTTSGPNRAPITASLQSSSTSTDQPRKRTSKTPLIIIPAAGTSLITMYNVRDMLQELKFITTEEKKSIGRRENEVLLHRKRGDITVPYRVVDNPMKLTDEEWERVVAVFVMGPAWQFKGWRWGGNPVEIFSHVAAFHVHYDDMKLDMNVAKWSVTRLPISRDKRHLDKARLAKFWDIVILATLIAYVSCGNAITCSFCKAGLASMTANIQSDPDLMGQMGDTISQGCDQVPNKLQRKACRFTLDDNFPLFFQNFISQPDNSADNFCESMGYC